VGSAMAYCQTPDTWSTQTSHSRHAVMHDSGLLAVFVLTYLGALGLDEEVYRAFELPDLIVKLSLRMIHIKGISKY
jgi:hypothetical protein